MYNPLTEDLMLQDRHERAEHASHPRGAHPSAWPTRRWWGRGSRRRR
jgi:hypothetical protein